MCRVKATHLTRVGNRNRLLTGIGVEIFTSSTGEQEGALNLLKRARKRLRLGPRTMGADKGYFAAEFLKSLRRRRIKPHVAPKERGRQPIHKYVKRLTKTMAYQMSQRARKKEESAAPTSQRATPAGGRRSKMSGPV